MKYLALTYLKRIIIALVIVTAGIASITIYTNTLVEKAAIDKTYTSASEIPYNKVGLVLGTAKKLSNGRINLYYKYRIEATAKLYNAKKISYVLISGDNSRKSYDEPSTFKEDLILKGIPDSCIFLDYAGFRTLDSVVRCKEIFGQSNITIISQKFHNERALYIANYKEINAVGFNAKSVSKKYGFKTRAREYLARVKMMLDLVINRQPKFLGEKVIIK